MTLRKLSLLREGKGRNRRRSPKENEYTEVEGSPEYQAYFRKKEEPREFRDNGEITSEEYDRLVKNLIKSIYGPGEENSTPVPDKGISEKDVLVRWLSIQSESVLQPWKLNRRRVPTLGDALGQGEDQDTVTKHMRKQFLTRARGGDLTPTGMMLGQYVFLGSGLHTIRTNPHQLLIGVPRETRTTLHNWWVHRLWPEVLQENHSATVDTLAHPLFPPGTLDDPNVKPLTAATDPHGGGENDAFATLFNPRHDQADVQGGAYTEAVVDANGTQVAAVSMEGTDARPTELHRNILELSKIIGRNAQRTRTPAPRRTQPNQAYLRYPRPAWHGGKGQPDEPAPPKNQSGPPWRHLHWRTRAGSGISWRAAASPPEKRPTWSWASSLSGVSPPAAPCRK